tara:strand:- start:357 stop:596 length:240 start_codon:yes stop_codon:yes gene_type:complete
MSDSSSAKFLGLKKGDSAPQVFEKSDIASSSVETYTESRNFELFAASIVAWIIGFPLKNIIFLFGKPLEPLLAGIIAII